MEGLFRLASGELARLEFGGVDPSPRTLDERLDAILADRPARLVELWDLPAWTLSDIMRQRFSRTDLTPDALVGLLAVAGYQGSPCFVQPVYEWRDHPAAVVRAAVLECLGRLQATVTIETVRAALAAPEPAVRRAAIIAAGKLGDRTLGARLADGGPVPAELTADVEEAEKRVRLLDRGEVDALHRRYLKGDDADDLLKLVPFYWESLLALVLPADSPPLYRMRALELLGVRRYRRAASYLVPLLGRSPTEPLEFRVALVEALGRMRYGPAGDTLIELLRSGEPELREPVIRALADLGDAAAVEPLLEFMERAEEGGGRWRPVVRAALTRLAARPLRPILEAALHPVEVDQWTEPPDDLPARLIALFDDAGERVPGDPERALETPGALPGGGADAVRRDIELYLSVRERSISPSTAD